MLVERKRISIALGLLVLATGSARAQAPGRNQATADAVAQSLGSSKALAGTRIEVEAREGVVSLSGSVATPAHKAEALDRARRVAGVTALADRLMVADARIKPAQYQTAMHGHGRGGAMNGGAANGGVVTDGTSMPSNSVVSSGTTTFDGPLPEGAAGEASFAGKPGMPNYAWPSYAPNQNFSAVGYPTAYPWQAWPNIGPFYPYPEVPLDWRAVTLRWDDGIWWLDFKKNYTRPFFTPYPFGIGAY